MADRSVDTTDTLEAFRTTFNSTAADVGDIADLNVQFAGTPSDLVEGVNSKAHYTGQNTIVTVGTIATGTWQGTAVADAYVANDLTIDGGTVDNSVIGGSTPAAATFSNVTLASGATVTAILDEDTMVSDSATALATQQSIKAYVDNLVTIQDLDFAGDSGTGAVDLDSQTFTVSGTINEIETSASGQTITIGLPSDVTIGNDLSITGNVTSGTWQGTAVAVSYGGTGATTASGARTNLGLVINTDVQAYDAELAAIAGLTSAADKGIYFTGSGTASTFDLTSFGRSILDDADEATFKATVNLEIGTDVQAYDADTAKTDVAQTFTAAQRGEITTLTSATSVTIDMADSNNFTCTMGHNITFANPTNLTAGQSGSIFLVQDGTGSRTGSWGTYWDFAGGTAPTLTTTPAAVDRIDYVVRSSTSIHAVATLNLS